MSKFDNLNKVTIPDPLTGGMQDIYTSQDGTFAMCIPHKEIKTTASLPIFKYENIEGGDGMIRVWSFENTNKDDKNEIPKE